MSTKDRRLVTQVLESSELRVRIYKGRVLVESSENIQARAILFEHQLPKKAAGSCLCGGHNRDFARSVGQEQFVDELEQIVESLDEVSDAEIQAAPVIDYFEIPEVKVLVTLHSQGELSEDAKRSIKNLLDFHWIATDKLEFVVR